MSLKVFKFGGASLRDADNIRNVAAILKTFTLDNLLIVVSAIGKTTNALEDVVKAYFAQDNTAFTLLNNIHKNHHVLMQALFSANDPVFEDVNDTFIEIEWILEDEPHDTYDYIYDQIVSIGELVSSKILAAYLQKEGFEATWLDARDVLKTDDTWREAVVDWKITRENVENNVKSLFNAVKKPLFVITQGFIGSTKDNNTATLGREGSDYSAAIFSHCLDAEAMYIWKDVDGVYSGDPRIFKETVKLDKISYEEAVEMTYYGATVVHPRTIQPLMAKNIPLCVRSFIHHEAVGTIISSEAPPQYPPIFMTEKQQVFLKMANKDFTFLVEPHIRDLFDVFSKYHIFVNLLQNSGAYFYVSITSAPDREVALMAELREKFIIETHRNVDLFTIRHPTDAAIALLKQGKQVYFEKMIPQTYQVILG